MPLYRRPRSPHWWVRLGRKTRKSTGTDDREKAEEFERVLADRLWRLQRLGDRGAISWKDAAERWLADSARARKRDREFLTWLEPHIGESSVSEVAHPDALEELRKLALAKGWQHSTIDRLMNTVSAVLHKCAQWRYLEYAPKVPMYRPAIPEPRWLTRPQFEALCKELPEHLEIAARFAVSTLLRMRSQARLTWDRVDLRHHWLWVPGSQMKAKRPHGVPLNTETMKVLRRAKSLGPTGERVFQYEGQPIENFHTEAFRKAVKRAKVGPLRWHDLRHTGASWAIQSGMTLPELMQFGGWSSYQMVLRYAHLAPVHVAKAARRVAQREHTRKRVTREK